MSPKSGTKSDSLYPYTGSAESPSLRAVRSIPGVILKGSNGLTGPGIGMVRSSDNGAELQFKAPGSLTWGAPVPIPVDDIYILLDGDDPDKYLRVEVKRDFLAIQDLPTTESIAEGYTDPNRDQELGGVVIDPAIRDYYRKVEIDNMWEGYTDTGKGQVAWSSIVGDISDAFTAGDNLHWAPGPTLNLDPSISVVDVTLSGVLKPHMDDLAEPTGFVYSDDTESTLAFNDGSRIFTIAPVAADFSFYHCGKKYTKTSAETTTIPDTEGLHYIYYNSSGNLVNSLSFPGWAHAWVAMIQWDATNKEGIILNERHRFQNPNIHYRDHFALGALFTGGFGISGYTLDTDTNAGVTFGIDSGTFSDEDIEHAHAADPDPATAPVMYLDGAGADVRWDTGTDYAFKNTGAGRVNWNEFTGGAWQQTECTDNYHVAYFVCAWTNDGGAHELISIQGQREDQKLLDAAINNEFGDLELGDFGPELRPLYRLIIQSKSTFGGDRKAKIQHVEDIRSINVPAGAAATQASHARLHDLDSSTDHALGGMTTSRLVSTDAGGLVSVTDLTSWIAGTADQITVTDDVDGTITISIPSPLKIDTIWLNNIYELTPAAGITVHDHIYPGISGTLDFGDVTRFFRTLHLSNDGGNIIYCENPTSSKTSYQIWAGGGGSWGGGDLIVQFGAVIGGTNSENGYTIDFGPVDFANAEHHYVFQSTGNGAFIGDVKVSTVFGGALGARTIGFEFTSSGTFQYYNNIDCRMGTALSAGYDPLNGNNVWKKFELQFDGNREYRVNYSSTGWHGFDMAPDYMSPAAANYAMVVIDALTDRLSASRISRAALRLMPPTPDLNGNTLTYATCLQILGNPAVAGANNSGIFLGNSASLILSNVNTGTGPTMTGITNFGGADMLWLQPGSANAQLMQLMLPNGTSEHATLRFYNYSNLLSFTYSTFDVEVDGADCNMILRETGAAPTPITAMNIGGDATSGLLDINFLISNSIIANIDSTGLDLNGNNISNVNEINVDIIKANDASVVSINEAVELNQQAHNIGLKILGYAGYSTEYIQFLINSGGQTIINSTDTIAMNSNTGAIYLQAAGGQHEYFDCGGIFYWRDADASQAHRMRLDSATGVLEIDNLEELTASAGVTIGHTLILSTVINAGVDTDKFLVLDSSDKVDFRTGSEVLSDIGVSGLIATHAALDTGVHGAGGDTLATDADIATHTAIATAHQDAPGLIATHTAIATAHQDAPALIATHAALDTGVHGAGVDTLATDADIATHTAIATAHQDAPGLIATHTAIATAHQDAPALIATHTAIATAHQDAPALIATHAALDTGVHGAGGDTLATDADIATHTAIATAHQDAPALIATHAGLPDAHHPQSHTIVSHSDTTGTGPELNELTGGGVTALHSHAAGGGDVTAAANLTDTAIVVGDGGAKGIKTSVDADTVHALGRIKMGYDGVTSDEPVLSHYDNMGVTDYALKMAPTYTVLNAPSGGNVVASINNSQRFYIDGTFARSEGPFKIKETAWASTSAAYGQLRVQNDAPNTLWFEDDGGNRQKISGGVFHETGTYTGDGTTSNQINLKNTSLIVFFVKVWQQATSEASRVMGETTDTIVDDIAAGASCYHSNSSGQEHRIMDNQIIDMGTGYFTVDDGGANTFANASGTVYNYLVLGTYI